MTLRVVVADDSEICRELLCEWLEADGDLEVVGAAADGEAAIEMIARLRPDVATIDLQMPKVSGLEVVSILMARAPLPIVVLTGQATGGADTDLAFEAIRRGALDLVLKPSGLDDDAIDALRARVRMLAGVPVVRHLEPHGDRPERRTHVGSRHAAGDPVLVGIAASSGGPRALATVLGGLAPELPICVAVVQHLPRGFTQSFVNFLQGRCALAVCVAEAGMVPRPGTVVLAPDDHHLELVGGRFALTTGAPTEGHRPSGTVLLRSLAVLGPSAIGVVLSGIGRDGADGLRAMRGQGGVTIAQDAATSIVYGMPRAAVEEGGAAHGLAVERIADAIADAVGAMVPLRPRAGG